MSLSFSCFKNIKRTAEKSRRSCLESPDKIITRKYGFKIDIHGLWNCSHWMLEVIWRKCKSFHCQLSHQFNKSSSADTSTSFFCLPYFSILCNTFCTTASSLFLVAHFMGITGPMLTLLPLITFRKVFFCFKSWSALVRFFVALEICLQRFVMLCFRARSMLGIKKFLFRLNHFLISSFLLLWTTLIVLVMMPL